MDVTAKYFSQISCSLQFKFILTVLNPQLSTPKG